jgi:hypothetical protein
MSVGGKVVEVVICTDKVWINTKEKDATLGVAIYVERSPQALAVSNGDSVWWQGQYAYWTPKNRAGQTYAGSDIKLRRIGCSGVSRPIFGPIGHDSS